MNKRYILTDKIRKHIFDKSWRETWQGWYFSYQMDKVWDRFQAAEDEANHLQRARELYGQFFK